jgi:HD-like signal output (HDOD) protein/ActR/RegA family two-component response regulator
MKPAVLFVDDTENILQGLRRNLRTMRDEWDLHFALSGAEALKLMSETHIDVIVSDIRMPGMDGAALLKQVSALYGHTIRMVLSGQCDEDALTTLLEVSHQYMAKPLDTATIVAAIKPILAVKASLQDQGLAKFITGIASLPSLPSLHESIVTALREDHPVKDIENLLLRDISLVAKIFQVMNSSYFGANRDINTLAYVWELLGLERIKTLILGGHIIAPLEKALEGDPFITDLWNLSLMTARIARLIAKAEDLPQKTCDKAWVAGLLHAIGALILHEYRRQKKGAVDVSDLLNPDAPSAYPCVGGFLAVLWGLPRDIRHVILHHAAPEKAGDDGDKTLLAIIHAARVFAHVKMNPSASETEYLNENFLRQAGVFGKFESWKAEAETI